MNKSILLLVVVGLAVAGWLHRETISGWMAQRTAGEGPAEDASQSPEAGSPGNPVKPSVTPNPAAEAVAQARKIYPALAKAGSAFNLHFVALFNEMRVSNSALLAHSDWPIQLAERTAKELGGGALPRSGSQGASGWTDNYAEALESAKLDNKKLLLDFTGSDWCGYCMALEKEVLSTAKFQAWARENVVLVRLDFPKNHPQSTRVKEQNTALEAKYSVHGYPTIMIVDANGRSLGSRSGYTPGSGPDAFIAMLETTMRR